MNLNAKNYESEEKLAKAVNKDPRTIRRWLSNGKIKEVKEDKK